MASKYLRMLALFLALSLLGGVAAAAEKVIAYIPPGMISPFYAVSIKGAEAVAQKYGYKLRVLSPERETDYAGQVRIVEDMITEKVDGISICAINADAVAAAIRKANDANIPVVVFNGLTELPNCKVEAYVGYDQRNGGRKVGEFINERLNGKGNLAIIQGLPGYHTIEREGGIRDIVGEKFPGIKIVAAQPGDWEREKGMNAAQNMLTANPDINAFVGLSDEMALGAVQAKRAAGRDDIIVCGIDGNPNALDSVKAGRLDGTLYVYPHKNGSLAIEAMHEIFQGKKVDLIWEIPTVVANKNNIDEIINIKID
ncbi:MAG: sugar ABC transporter substrate-binding protein [Planctomycetota bacterium]|nr:sugar ABC transporter substrate-binding protein [Planctomycetota bacterium]